MAVETINFSLPEPLKRFVDERVAGGGYSSASEYLRELIRKDQERQDRQHLLVEKLEALLLEGLNSGEAIEWTPEYRAQRRERLIARAKAEGCRP